MHCRISIVENRESGEWHEISLGALGERPLLVWYFAASNMASFDIVGCESDYAALPSVLFAHHTIRASFKTSAVLLRGTGAEAVDSGAGRRCAESRGRRRNSPRSIGQAPDSVRAPGLMIGQTKEV